MHITYKLNNRIISRKSLNQIIGGGNVDKFTEATLADFRESIDEASAAEGTRFSQEARIAEQNVKCIIVV